ncbi:MAG: hypothetical protein ACLFOY_02575 [Desulfatibacillaceae bacterium]
MKRIPCIVLAVCFSAFLLAGCGGTHKPKPVPIKPPSASPNKVTVAGADVAAVAYQEPGQARDVFGYDIRGAGILPVRVVFDNQGESTLRIVPDQTFLEDAEGNLWPVLSSRMAYDRASRYAKTEKMFKEGAYGGFLGATAGALVGAAVGVVTGDFGEAVGKGAAVGGAAGAVIGGGKEVGGNEAGYEIERDLDAKTLDNKDIPPQNISYGIIFFPGEAPGANRLRLQVREVDSEQVHTVYLPFS